MKHTLYILLIITALVFVSCTSKSKETKTVQNPPAVQTEQPAAAETTDTTVRPSISVNHSFLTEENVGQTFTIKGYLSQNGENFILTENPTSKSRVTFYLEVADQSLIEKAKGLVNSNVEVTGVLTSAPSPWNKRLKVEKID